MKWTRRIRIIVIRASKYFPNSSLSKEIVKDTFQPLGRVTGSRLMTIHSCLVQSRVWKPGCGVFDLRRNLCRWSGPPVTLGEFRGDVFTLWQRISNSERGGPPSGESGSTSWIALLLIVTVPCKAIFRSSSLPKQLVFRLQLLHMNWSSFRCMSASSLVQRATLRGPCLKSSLGHVDSGSLCSLTL